MSGGVTKRYVDATFVRVDGTNVSLAALSLHRNKITDVADPTLAQDATTKNYTDATFIKVDGTNGPTTSLPLNDQRF